MRCGLIAGSCILALLVPAAADAAAAGGENRLRIETKRSSRYAEDFPKRLTVFISDRKDRALRRVRAQLIDPATDRVVAHGRARGGASPVPVVLELKGRPVDPGRYTLAVTAKEQGDKGRGVGESSLNFLSRADTPPGPLYPALGPTPLPGSGVVVQQATVDWRAGDFEGNDQDGFVVPGIGHGVLTCRPDTQWLRVFPGDDGRETTMMNWTFKDWESWREHAVRENVSRSGNDFNEGLNKFGPTPEKVSHGYFVGLITDRLPLGDAGGPSRAPTTVRLTWEWDFTDPANSRCFATATLISQPSAGPTDAVSSLSVNWRGDDNAPANASDAAVVPGLGTFELTCEAGPGGTRTLTVLPEPGVSPAEFTVFESSEAAGSSQDVGPYTQRLPNNGIVTAKLGDAGSLIVSSRFKVNDPDRPRNFCHIAAQITAA